MKKKAVPIDAETLKVGSLVEHTSPRFFRPVLRVSNMEYVQEIINKHNRWLSLQHGTEGRNSVIIDWTEDKKYPALQKTIGVYLGWVMVLNYLSDVKPKLFAVILFENGVHLINAQEVYLPGGLNKETTA